MSPTDKVYDFSWFSAGTVQPKYLVVEWIISPKRFDRWHAGITFGWVALWIAIMFTTGVDWIGLAAFLPILLGHWLGEQLFRYKPIGLVTLKDSHIHLELEGKEPQRIDLRQLRSLGLWPVICDPSVKRGCDLGIAWALMLSFRHEGVVQQFAIVNKMYLTPDDRMQFMRPPPSLGGLIQAACDAYRVRLYNAKGKFYEQ